MEVYIIPAYFLKINALFTILFALVTLFTGILAYKLYRLTKKKELKFFSLAFFSFAVAYLLQFIIYFIVRVLMYSGVPRKTIKHDILPLHMLQSDGHAFFLLLGLILILYTTHAIKENKLVLLLFATMSFALFLTPKQILLIHIFAILLLFYIVDHFKNNYRKNPTTPKLITLISFVFLLSSHLIFIFARTIAGSFIWARVFELAAYIGILITLMLVCKKKK